MVVLMAGQHLSSLEGCNHESHSSNDGKDAWSGTQHCIKRSRTFPKLPEMLSFSNETNSQELNLTESLFGDSCDHPLEDEVAKHRLALQIQCWARVILET